MSPEGFLLFCFSPKRNRRLFWLWLVWVIGSWLVFKLFYASPNLIFDSYHYVRAAAMNYSVNAWPIGYSKFLQLVGFFSHSVLVLLTVQYLLLEFACICFFFSWIYVFRPGKVATSFFFFLLFANPLLLFCSNFVLSDILFVAFSIGWITQLVWLIYRPRVWNLILQVMLLGIAFSIRYNALYYPIVAILAFLLCQRSWVFKATGIGLSLCIVFGFVLLTTSKMHEFTGAQQFSPFGGWKLANNALYAYMQVPSSRKKPPPFEFRNLDAAVNHFKDTAGMRDSLLYLDVSSGSFFMLNTHSPLMGYLREQTRGPWQFLGTKEWLAIAPFYGAYGGWIIRNYPVFYGRYFVWPNLGHYLLPPNEILGSELPFQWNETYGGVYVRKQFGISSLFFSRGAIATATGFFRYYPVVFFLLHLSFLLSSLLFVFIGGWRHLSPVQRSCITMVLFFWAVDLVFSAVSAWIVLRYQLFSGAIELGCLVYFADFIYFRLREKDRLQEARRGDGKKQSPLQEVLSES